MAKTISGRVLGMNGTAAPPTTKVGAAGEIIDRLGVELVLPSPLSEDEIVGLRRSADTVKDVIKSLGL
jgi:hypothetical protein